MTLDLTRIQALCFDVDGTLNNTDDQFVHKIASWLKPFQGLFPLRDPLSFARYIVMSSETPAQFFFGLPDRVGLDEKLNEMSDWFYRRSKKPASFSIIPGVPEMLSTLYPHFPMSIVTARGLLTTQMFLEQYALHPHFHSIAAGQTCPHTKPYPDPIFWAAQQMGVAAQNCLMIGDTVVDIRAGKAAGAQTVGVLCGFGTEDELRQAGADLILETTGQLAQMLQKS